LAIVDAIAVAHIEIALGAVPPECVLHEPGKDFRERSVELPGIDVCRDGPDDVGAAVRPVAGQAVGMIAARASEASTIRLMILLRPLCGGLKTIKEIKLIKRSCGSLPRMPSRSVEDMH
jgi:hypothetical protein